MQPNDRTAMSLDAMDRLVSQIEVTLGLQQGGTAIKRSNITAWIVQGEIPQNAGIVRSRTAPCGRSDPETLKTRVQMIPEHPEISPQASKYIGFRA